MKIGTLIFLSAIVPGAYGLTIQVSYAASGMSAECAKANTEKFTIKEYKNKMVSVCLTDDAEGCQYTATYGKTFVDSRLHLNIDRLNDYAIKDFSTGYGNNDVVRFMLFAQCHDGNFVKVVDDFFSSVKPERIDPSTGWLKLRVTRACYDEKIGDTQERSYIITFDQKKMKYGPPDSNPELTNYCSDAELSSPADSASTPK